MKVRTMSRAVLGLLVTVALSLGGAGAAHGFAVLSTTVGTFTDVVWEPNEENPERVQLHGVFWSYSYVNDPEGSCEPELELDIAVGGGCRTVPTEGYIYYWCDPEVEILTDGELKPITLTRCVSDWQAIVETHDQTGCVGFGEKWISEPLGADKMVEPIRAPGTPAVDPDPYHVFGTGNLSLFTDCADADQATPPVCGDGVHHAGEWCDGNCYPDSGEECSNSAAPTSRFEAGLRCGCGAVEPVGTAAACDLRCVDNRLGHCTDDDGCCTSPTVTYCDGGCCLDPEMPPSSCDNDCVPGALIEVTCHTNADCGGGATCVHPNTIQSYCSGEGGSEPTDAGSSETDATSNTGDAEPSVEPETGPTDEPGPDAAEEPGTDAPDEPLDTVTTSDFIDAGTDPPDEPVEDDTPPPTSAGDSSGGCAAGGANGEGPVPWLLILVLALAALQRRGAERVTSGG